MKESAGKRIAVRCGVLLLTGVLWGMVGCGQGKASEKPEQKEMLQYELLKVQDPDNTNVAGLLQEKAAGCMVRIQTENLAGSGVIWHTNAEKMVILTAAHVLDGAKEVKVTFCNQETMKVSAHKLRIAEDCDLGILEIPSAALPDSVWEDCRTVVADKEFYDRMGAGDRILVMGSVLEAAGNAYEGRLKESWIFLEDYDQYMMLAATYAEPGMSGGGVFDEQGRLIGILSGADAQGNLAIVPLAFILREF